jgi:hypothetical protein
MTEKKQFKRWKDLFCAQFQRFQTKVSWIHCFGSEARENILMVGVYGRVCSLHDDQEAETDFKGLETMYILPEHTPHHHHHHHNDLLHPNRLHKPVVLIL